MVKGAAAPQWPENRVQRIGDVHAFPGHIACDSVSNTEVVLPITLDERVVGVLDIDSTIYQRFDQDDENGLKTVMDYLSSSWKPPIYAQIYH